MQALTASHGPDPNRWTLAELQTLLFRHELSGAFPGSCALFDLQTTGFGGGNSTLGRARHRYTSPFKATGCATVRVVLEMSDPIRAYAVTPGGQSGHPLSPHDSDQLDFWMSGQLLPLANSPEDARPAITVLHPQS